MIKIRKDSMDLIMKRLSILEYDFQAQLDCLENTGDIDWDCYDKNNWKNSVKHIRQIYKVLDRARSKKMKQLIRQEIESNYDLRNYDSFEDFWNVVYREHLTATTPDGITDKWRSLLAKGIAAVYAAVYFEIKSEERVKR